MSSDSSMNVMGIVLLVLLLANLGVSIYVAAKVRSATAEEDYKGGYSNKGVWVDPNR